MAAETHLSSSSSSNNYNYDVFLSFRGEDTRRTFTDHLYDAMLSAGIRTFRDNNELNHGEEIAPTLLTAIEQSRISIPIFSKNYASSKWCLQELTKMMECKITHGQIVLPIFYKVEPCHVRNQTGCFEEAFLKHEKEQTGCFFFLAIIGCFKNVFLKHKREQSEEKVMTWRKSLNEAGKLKGWNSEDPEYSLETNLINSVVERALTEVIQITNFHVAKHPIGIESHVEEVMRMLDVESKDVLFVGIHGMGGIGKTTTAKAIFNKISKQFGSKSFLTDVREKASQGQGLVNLQNALASDLLKGKSLCISAVDKGINVIKERFYNKKVLIVLDDVDHDKQLQALAGGCDWFGQGSRIIITTRDKHILNVGKVDKSKIYEPNKLDENLSLQLFSKHAFETDQPPQDLWELSKEIVSILGGLPLALEVVGSFLYDKKEHTDWEDTLNTLRESPDKDVQKQLKISYDGLDLADQKLFLDIACFFIGMDQESVIPACQACDYFPRLRIKVLVHKSLVKIDNDNKLRMHDQLRDMGREIVRQENLDKPGERTRLWSHEKALDVLKKYEGTGKVEGLFLDFGYQENNHHIDFDSEAENHSTDSSSEEENYLTDFDHEAKNEKLPQIDPADLLTKAFEKMSDLRLLQVDGADHDENNFGQLPPGLKWLSLKGISCKCVPTISHLKKLAVLDLSGSNITDDWIGWQQIQLIRTLKVLDLSTCYFLERTPHFSCDTSLERLILSDCHELVAVHESIGHLKNLVFLSLNWCCKLTELPDSICKLSSIKSLILTWCRNLEKLPKELGNMKSLTELSIDWSGIKEIPDSIGLLEKLERLSAKGCENLTELPDSICKRSSIKSLNLDYCHKLEKLPKELDNMESLTELLIDGTRIEEIPDSIGLLEKLETLSARNCKRLKKLPNLSNLKSLRALWLKNCEGLFEIQGISGLSLLRQIDLENCRTLQLLPELPRGLELLRLEECYELAKIESIDGLTLLQELDLTNCRKLQSLPELPSSLIKLNATNCSSIERLPNLSNLKSLQALWLSNCEGLVEIQGISGLSLLQQIDLENCRTLQLLPELPRGLIKLNIRGCSSMERLPNLSTLKNLEELRLDKCFELAKIESIDGLTLLQELDLTDCRKLQSLPGLPSSLIKLDAGSCGSIKTLPNLSNLKILQVLHLCCSNLSEIQDIRGLSLLRELDLKDCKMLQYLPGLPSSLIKLEIAGCISMERSPNLSSLRGLKVLRLKNCMNLANSQGINDLTLLQELDLNRCSSLQSLSELPSSLTRLNVYDCESLFEIQGINDLTLLQELDLHSCRELQSLDLSNLRNLMSLHLENCDNLAEIRGLESLESLFDLQVRECHTYIKTIQKSVSQGMLPTAVFNEGEIWKKYLMIPDDDNIKGTIFYFVYQAEPWLINRGVFSITVLIRRNGATNIIGWQHKIGIEGMDVNTDEDGFYSCYFQGLTWFGFPLKKRDIILVMNAGFQIATFEVKLKMLDLVMEYEAMEDSQQLENRVVRLITSTTKKRPREYDDAGPSNSKQCLPRGMTDG